MSYAEMFDHASAVRAAEAQIDALRHQRLNAALYGLTGPSGERAEIEHASLSLRLRERALSNFCRDCHRPDSLLNIKDSDDRALLLEAGTPQRAAA
jgi:hypothetical protein